MANATLVPKRDAAQTLSPPLPACGEGIEGWGSSGMISNQPNLILICDFMFINLTFAILFIF
ncbi:hypothetical protein NIES2130_17025 [Scytonema sp. HK-05]|nr:hypothetical protein NIES2130_17025 [Scytonema sp. HK-05]